MGKKIVFSPEIAEARAEYFEIIARAKNEKWDALMRWNDLSIKEIDLAATQEDVLIAFRAAPWGAPAKEYALAKWVGFCTAAREVEAARKIFSGRANVYRWGPLLKRWVVLSDVEIQRASTFGEAGQAFVDAPPYGTYQDEVTNIRQKAFSKWLSFCVTLDDLSRLREYFGNIHDDLRQLYYDKHAELSLK